LPRGGNQRETKRLVPTSLAEIKGIFAPKGNQRETTGERQGNKRETTGKPNGNQREEKRETKGKPKGNRRETKGGRKGNQNMQVVSHSVKFRYERKIIRIICKITYRQKNVMRT
jgi:hypothetical protein